MQRVIFMIMIFALLLVACSEEPEKTVPDAPEESSPEVRSTRDLAPATEAIEATQEQVVTEPAPASEEPASFGQTAPSMLTKVRERGYLICGVNAEAPGFGYLDAEGNLSGFDVDFCQVISATIFGDASKVEYRQLTLEQSFTAVQIGEVDILVRNTPNTLSHETSVGLDFGPTIFYDGLGMMVRKDSGITTLADLDGTKICVEQGSSSEETLTATFQERDLTFSVVTFMAGEPIREAYDGGECDALSNDKSKLISDQALLREPTAHEILDITMSKEPLAPSILQGDVQWREIMTWAVYATFQAEEFGITSENVEEMTKSENRNIAQFLGTRGELGETLGVSNDFAVNIIKAVGNYGEIYERHFGASTPFALPRGMNAPYYEGGLLYSPPFR